jgi:hypothetical protein
MNFLNNHDLLGTNNSQLAGAFITLFIISVLLSLLDILLVSNYLKAIHHLLYALFFIYFISFSQIYLNRKQIYSVYTILVIIKSVSLLNLGANTTIGGDPGLYHIPNAISIGNFNNITSWLFNENIISGKLTHVLIFLNIKFLDFIGVKADSFKNIFMIMHYFNFFISIVTLNFVYKTTFLYSNSISFARRAMFFVAFHPFFISYGLSPRKESILFLSLSLLIYYLLSRNKTTLIAAITIVLFDRIYMVPLYFAIYIFVSHNKIIYKTSMIIILFFLIEYFLGIDRAMSIHSSYLKSVQNIGESYLPDNSVYYDILRTLFAPSPLRHLDTMMASYLIYLYFYILAIKSLFYIHGIKKILPLVYIYVCVFFPLHSTFKLLLLTIFSVLYLDDISFRKLNNKIIRAS